MSLDIDSMTTLIQLIGVFTFEKLRLFNLEIVQIVHWNNVKNETVLYFTAWRNCCWRNCCFNCIGKLLLRKLLLGKSVIGEIVVGEIGC